MKRARLPGRDVHTYSGGELAEQDQEGGLEVVGLLGELLDGDAAVQELTLITVQVGDR